MGEVGFWTGIDFIEVFFRLCEMKKYIRDNLILIFIFSLWTFTNLRLWSECVAIAEVHLQWNELIAPLSHVDCIKHTLRATISPKGYRLPVELSTLTKSIRFIWCLDFVVFGRDNDASVVVNDDEKTSIRQLHMIVMPAISTRETNTVWKSTFFFVLSALRSIALLSNKQ